MTEPLPPDIPQAVAADKPRWAPSLVWLVPLVAAAVGGWLAIKAVLERGPDITITFSSAESLEAGKTRIKFKNVDIGEVTRIALAPDRKRVVVSARMSREAAGMLVEDTNFWVVRPRVASGSVSGLSTLLSGAYIGVDAGRSQESRRAFEGLDTPPVVTGDLAGRQFALRGEDMGSLDIGSPVFFRRVQVGQVMAYGLDRDGKGVTLTVFVGAPYDQYVTADTRFWHASGFDVTLDAAGIKVDTESLLSLAIGGVAFQTPAESADAPAAAENSTFRLHADRVSALKRPDTTSETYRLVFDESVRGLSVGAPVDFRGVALGEVTDVGIDVDPATHKPRMVVDINVYLDRLARRRIEADARPPTRSQLAAMIERGLRAQLRSGNVLTGQLYVALDFFPNAPRAKLDASRKPVEFPTAPGSLNQLQETVTRIAERLDKVPFDAIGADARKALQDIDRAAQSAEKLVAKLDAEVATEARATLEETRRTLEAAQRTLSADAPLQTDIRETMRELARAAQSLRTLTDYLDRHPEAFIRGKPEATTK